MQQLRIFRNIGSNHRQHHDLCHVGFAGRYAVFGPAVVIDLIFTHLRHQGTFHIGHADTDAALFIAGLHHLIDILGTAGLRNRNHQYIGIIRRGFVRCNHTGGTDAGYHPALSLKQIPSHQVCMVAGASANQHNGLDIPFFYLGSDLFTHLTVSRQTVRYRLWLLKNLLPKNRVACVVH